MDCMTTASSFGQSNSRHQSAAIFAPALETLRPTLRSNRSAGLFLVGVVLSRPAPSGRTKSGPTAHAARQHERKTQSAFNR